MGQGGKWRKSKMEPIQEVAQSLGSERWPFATRRHSPPLAATRRRKHGWTVMAGPPPLTHPNSDQLEPARRRSPWATTRETGDRRPTGDRRATGGERPEDAGAGRRRQAQAGAGRRGRGGRWGDQWGGASAGALARPPNNKQCFAHDTG